MMPRIRMAARPCSSRSSTVPPISTRNWLPKFSAIAAVSHGVAMSSEIGPFASSHHSAPHQQDGDATPARQCRSQPPHPADLH